MHEFTWLHWLIVALIIVMIFVMDRHTRGK